jgi:2-polyprenyl-6-methoxyphenol hydroxylase-like FAD-dependent oxidoreductase
MTTEGLPGEGKASRITGDVMAKTWRPETSDAHSSAIVLGASMSGLLTVQALSGHFKHITVVERDVLPEGAEVRQGIPQAAHAHGLLASGYRVMDDYFPGLMDELSGLGARLSDVVGNFLWFQYGRWKLRYDAGLRGIAVSRPCLEAAIRRRVKALPNVTFLEGADGVRPTFNAAAGRVTGLIVRRRNCNAEEQLAADLVIDATGRGSRSPRWLEEGGFGQPEMRVVKVNVGYATRIFERRSGEFFNSSGGVVSGTPPGNTRYAAVLAAEENRWVVTLVGTVGDYPSTDEKEWMKFAASLPVSAVYDLVSTARPLTPIITYRFPAYHRRLYEQMKRFPPGYLVIGDALCNFNPIYGQGMSVAALEAKALDECLAAGLDGLASRFFSRAGKIIDIPWLIATGEDLRFPQVEGKRPTGFRLVSRYLERVHAVASEDPVVCRKFFDVLNLFASPVSLMSPRIAWRVLVRPARVSRKSPCQVMRSEARVPA